MTEYKYLCLMRPPTPGAIPRDGLQDISYDEGISETTGHIYWGIVTYNRELTPGEVWEYELEVCS